MNMEPEHLATWAAHDVAQVASHTKRFRHPALGLITTKSTSFAVTAVPGARIAADHLAVGGQSRVELVEAQALARLGIWEWDGVKCEHMMRDSHEQRAGTFTATHPFFKGMNLDRIRGIYRQMIPQPGSTATERFYKTRSLPRRK